MPSYMEQIEAIPSDPDKAVNYSELLSLWKVRRISEEPASGQLAVWDEKVLTLLTPAERDEYLDENRLVGRSEALSKLNRLTSILIGRHDRFGPSPNPVGDAASADSLVATESSDADAEYSADPKPLE